MSRVIHVEIHAQDVPRAVELYTSVFGSEGNVFGVHQPDLDAT